MATPTAIKFWKGTFAAYTKKLDAGNLTAGTLYFINEGALYLATANNAANLISPKRITDLANLPTGDTTSTATAKAIVDFVNAQFTDENGAYKKAVKDLQDQIDDLSDTKLDASEFDTAMTGITGTIAAAIDADVQAAKTTIDAYTVGGVAISAKPTLETMGVTGAISTAKNEAITYAQGLTVNGQTFGEDKIIVLTAGDIKLEDKDGAVTVKKELEDIRSIASAAMTFKGVKETVAELPTTGVENGDIYYVKADDTEYVYITDSAYGAAGWEALGGYVNADVYTKKEANTLLDGKVDKTVKVNGKALSSDVTLVAADIADVYSKTDADAAIDDAVKATKATIDAYTVGGVALSATPTLDSMGVTGAISTAKGEAISAAATTAGGLVDGLETEVRAFTVNNKSFGEDGKIALVAADITDVYSQTQANNLLAGKVDNTITVNGKALTANVTLTGDDIKVGTFATEGAATSISGTTTLSAAIKALDTALTDVTGGDSGSGGSLAKKMNKVTSATADNIVTLTSDGDAQDSGFKAGDAALSATPSATVLATEKAVADAISAAALVWVEE